MLLPSTYVFGTRHMRLLQRATCRSLDRYRRSCIRNRHKHHKALGETRGRKVDRANAGGSFTGASNHAGASRASVARGFRAGRTRNDRTMILANVTTPAMPPAAVDSPESESMGTNSMPSIGTRPSPPADEVGWFGTSCFVFGTGYIPRTSHRFNVASSWFRCLIIGARWTTSRDMSSPNGS